MKYLSLFILLITVFSCKKDDEPCSEKMSDYQRPVFYCLNSLMFDTGSVWLYQDTASSLQDQVSVLSWETYSNKGQSPCGGYYEELKINYAGWLDGNYTETYNLNYIRWGASGYPKYFCDASNILDSLVVNGTTYFNVTEITDIDYPYVTPNVQYYWVDSIGIIRKVIYNGPSSITTYDLQSYQVNILAYPL